MSSRKYDPSKTLSDSILSSNPRQPPSAKVDGL